MRGCVASSLDCSHEWAKTSPLSSAAKCASTSSSNELGHEELILVSDVLMGVAQLTACGSGTSPESASSAEGSSTDGSRALAGGTNAESLPAESGLCIGGARGSNLSSVGFKHSLSPAVSLASGSVLSSCPRKRESSAISASSSMGASNMARTTRFTGPAGTGSSLTRSLSPGLRDGASPRILSVPLIHTLVTRFESSSTSKDHRRSFFCILLFPSKELVNRLFLWSVKATTGKPRTRESTAIRLSFSPHNSRSKVLQACSVGEKLLEKQAIGLGAPSRRSR